MHLPSLSKADKPWKLFINNFHGFQACVHCFRQWGWEMGEVSVGLRCYNKNTIDQVALKRHLFFTVLEAGSPRLEGQHDLVLSKVPLPSYVCMWPSLVPESRDWVWVDNFWSLSLLIRTLIPSCPVEGNSNPGQLVFPSSFSKVVWAYFVAALF